MHVTPSHLRLQGLAIKLLEVPVPAVHENATAVSAAVPTHGECEVLTAAWALPLTEMLCDEIVL